MAQTIADIYEIEKEIGSGGGGVVYIGRHRRLDKPIVLKADKRSLSVGEETLRREVDMLKNLSHTYIPQVYDFIEQDGVVYTVMEYIDGVSLDQVLAWGKPIRQKDIIRWACQLLEALNYLHMQKPHGILHGDIKPANIMMRVNGDICLIDYNIALALGEDGAVKVGFSRGYASPEHYGSDYTGFRARDAAEFEKTEVLSESDPDQTLPATETSPKTVLLDVRSDIYSLGATLYHLLSGEKPAQNAPEVKKLTSACCSAGVAKIINKAMEPDPNRRYQSAVEMLEAFVKLRANDPRVIRQKRGFRAATAGAAVIFLVGVCLAFVGTKQMENHQRDLTYASYAEQATAEEHPEEAVSYAMKALEKTGSILEAPVTAEAQKALTDALGVYELADGYDVCSCVTLPSAPFDMCMSPEGTRYAVVYAYDAAVYDVGSSQLIATLPIQESALCDCVFLDEDTVICAGADGVQAYDLAEEKVLWTGQTATNLALSGDKKRVAAVDRDAEQAQIYDAETGELLATCDFEGKHLSVAENDTFADPQDDLFALDETGKQLAVSFSDGSLTVFNLSNTDESLLVFEESDYTEFSGGFSGTLFAFAASSANGNFFGVVDTDEASFLAATETDEAYLVRTDSENIYIADGSTLVKIDGDTLEETELAYTDEQKIRTFDVGTSYCMVSTEDGAVSFYDKGANKNTTVQGTAESVFVSLAGEYAIAANRDESSLRVFQLENHEDAQFLTYDTADSHDEARISSDGKTVMLFDYTGFCIYDLQGEKLAEVALPDADTIYDQQYRRTDTESYLEVTWYDGTVRTYGEDGALRSTEQTEAPSEELTEEFTTAQYKISAPLHGAASVYDRETGNFVTDLEEDAYLTYVTETGDYIVIQYVTADGETYGVLYNAKLEELAQLPGLVDVWKDTLLFDYESGDLRTSKIYTLEELMQLGNAYG